jgi:hypothetical protein
MFYVEVGFDFMSGCIPCIEGLVIIARLLSTEHVETHFVRHMLFGHVLLSITLNVWM